MSLKAIKSIDIPVIIKQKFMKFLVQSNIDPGAVIPIASLERLISPNEGKLETNQRKKPFPVPAPFPECRPTRFNNGY